MPYSVYILLNKFRTRTYTGVAVDVNERLKRHNDGHVPASRPYRPYEIIYAEACPTLKEARQRERFYKSTTGHRRIREIISSWAGKQVKNQKFPHIGPDNPVP
jgi:putative endonuclease